MWSESVLPGVLQYPGFPKSLRRDIRDHIQRFGLADAKPVLYPIDPGFNLVKAEECDKELPYMNLFGKDSCHIGATRPDGATALAKLGEFCASYDAREAVQCPKKLNRYFKGTIGLPLVSTKKPNVDTKEFDLVMFTDAISWADNIETQRSTSGWAIFLNGSPVLATSSRQTSVALSSTEAEIVALSEGCGCGVVATAV